MVKFPFVRKFTIQEYQSGNSMLATDSLDVCEVENAPTYQNYSGMH